MPNMHDDVTEVWTNMTNDDTHGIANQHIMAMPHQAADGALRTFPFRLGTPDDALPDAPVFGMFEQVVNPLAIDGLHDGNTLLGRRHDVQNEASDDPYDGYGDATIGTETSQPTVSHVGTTGDTPTSRETQRGQYDGMEWTQAARHEDADSMRCEGNAQASDGDIDGCLPSCGASMRPFPSFPSSASDAHDDVPDIHRPLDDGTFPIPDCDEIMRAIVDAYVARDDGVGNANARAVKDAIGWCDVDMSTSLAFSRHVDVVRTAGIIGRDAVKAVSGLWDVDGGIGGMLASTRGHIAALMPYSNRDIMACDGRDAGHGQVGHPDNRDAMHETGVGEFQRRLIGVIGMLGDAAGRRSVCTASFPICYPDRPLLVPLCDGDYDAHEWIDRQYWRKVPMHFGEDGRMHEDAWLTSRETLSEDGTSVIAVRRNGELGPQWCAWTEDLHVAGLALGMLHDVLAERSGLLSLSIAERDGGDLVGTVRKVWEWCAAYAWYL